MIIPVKQVGQLGLVVDRPYEEIPLNAWTDARNVRFRDGGVEKFSGDQETYSGAICAPYWLQNISGSTTFWLYGGLTKVGATDGASHADISRTVGGAYGTDLSIGWTGTIIEGIPVINNGVDNPQYWAGPALATPLADLTNWPASTTCRAMRSLKKYLLALDVTKSGTRYPYMVKWSDIASPGSLPASWDETDPTIDAGEYTLPAEGGYLIDGIPFRDFLILYKEYQTWLMEYIGGVDIFRFTRVFNSFGMLTRRCAVEYFSGKHIVWTGDDLVLHDGQQAQSLMDGRARNLLSGVIDTSYYNRAFVALNPLRREVWLGVPETGNSVPTLALVWNWYYNTLTFRELGGVAHAAPGIVDPNSAADTWAAAGNWDTDSLSWGDRAFSPAERGVLLAVPGTTKLLVADNSQTFDGTAMTSYVERKGLGFPLTEDGPPDFTTMKLVRGLWPKIQGTQGAIVNVYVGTQEKLSGAVTWGSAHPFTIGSTEFVDVLAAGRLHALKFESTTDMSWKLDGYDVDVVGIGMH